MPQSPHRPVPLAHRRCILRNSSDAAALRDQRGGARVAAEPATALEHLVLRRPFPDLDPRNVCIAHGLLPELQRRSFRREPLLPAVWGSGERGVAVDGRLVDVERE